MDYEDRTWNNIPLIDTLDDIDLLYDDSKYIMSIVGDMLMASYIQDMVDE